MKRILAILTTAVAIVTTTETLINEFKKLKSQLGADSPEEILSGVTKKK